MNQQQLQAKYLDLLRQYTETPMRPYDAFAFNTEFDRIECAMLDTPPPGCRKGLVLPGEMERPEAVPLLYSLTLEQASIRVMSDDEILAAIADQNRTPPDSYVKVTLNQGSVGSCGAESAVGGLMCRRNQDGYDHITLNPYAVYSYTSGGADRGSTLHDNLAVLQEVGCPSEAVWPRTKGWRTKPTSTALADAARYRVARDGVIRIQNRREFQTMVLAGYPVYFGYTGHAIFAVDLLDLTRFRYQNSWGASWGANGRGTLTYDRIYWAYGVYAIIALRGEN